MTTYLGSWTNWAHTVRRRPHLFSPSSVEELRDVLNQVRCQGSTLKAVGASHSPSDIAASHKNMISTDKLNRILRIDQSARTVLVEAGCRLSALNEHLDRLGFALPALGSISDISVGGLLSTGVHTSGANFPALSSYCIAAEVMDSNGDIHLCSMERDPDLFLAALCNCVCVLFPHPKHLPLVSRAPSELWFVLCFTSFRDSPWSNARQSIRSNLCWTRKFGPHCLTHQIILGFGCYHTQGKRLSLDSIALIRCILLSLTLISLNCTHSFQRSDCNVGIR